MMEELNRGDFEQFEKKLDSFGAKMVFSAFERESMRLSMYEMRSEFKKADEQINFMKDMRLKKKQKAQLGEQGFYLYLAQGRIKKAQSMLDMVKAYGSAAQSEVLEIQNSVLLRKEAKYIDRIKDMHEKLKKGTDQIDPSLNLNAGTFEYMIGLQYSYLKDKENTALWLKQAKERLKGTPYESSIDQVLETFGIRA
jgi:thioredoxin-like negative regulator of GroEL